MSHVEGNILGAADEDSSSDEDGELEVADAPPVPIETAVRELQIVDKEEVASKKVPAKDDSDDDDDDEPAPSVAVNALADIQLRHKAGRSGQGVRVESRPSTGSAMTNPSYGDEVWGASTNDQVGEDVALTTFSKVGSKKHSKSAPH
eukprot:TRINITY_DN9176_c0_g1_i1.p1 TRINITY_DN9176_c0_g1~~TRINITY_DN9176_c0_g1_i1.p1  ORF type:complete len:147 (+),score=33.09 TRINITY_DN9176_c0_g1_i1:51-491(+)